VRSRRSRTRQRLDGGPETFFIAIWAIRCGRVWSARLLLNLDTNGIRRIFMGLNQAPIRGHDRKLSLRVDLGSCSCLIRKSAGCSIASASKLGRTEFVVQGVFGGGELFGSLFAFLGKLTGF